MKIKLSSPAKGVVKWLTRLRAQRFFHDKLSLVLLFGSISLNAAMWILLAVRVRPTEFPVPVHYTSINGFDSLGAWYFVYSIGLFGIMVTLINSIMAVQTFSRSRITSFFLMAGSMVVAIFSLIISAAFTSIL